MERSEEFRIDVLAAKPEMVATNTTFPGGRRQLPGNRWLRPPRWRSRPGPSLAGTGVSGETAVTAKRRNGETANGRIGVLAYWRIGAKRFSREAAAQNSLGRSPR